MEVTALRAVLESAVAPCAKHPLLWTAEIAPTE
jgi:hypothetical protein